MSIKEETKKDLSYSPEQTDVQPQFSDPYVEQKQLSAWGKFVDGFKRQDANSMKHAEPAKKISARHVFMIAMSTGVGTGLWVGSGKSLHIAGPAGLLLGYAVISFMVFFVIDCAGELAVAFQGLAGGFNTYPRKFLDESLGFAISWNYCFQWLTVFSLELVTASMTIKYWTNVNSDIFVGPFYVMVLVINFFGAKGYGEAEFWFNLTKLITITGFILLAIIIDCGGAGNKVYIGNTYWENPGAFNNGFKGFCCVLVTAAFAFGGTEFVALTAAEQDDPRSAIPRAIKIVGYRIIFIFMLSLLMIGFLVPYNSDRLMGAGGSHSAASPFVIAVSSHGVKIVPHIINAVILISVISVANSAVYSSSRTLLSLADQGFAPKICGYVDKKGRPLVGLVVASIAGLFSFIAAYDKEESVFNWLLAISGLSTIFTWTSICICHIRFRAAMKSQGKSLDELVYKAKTGVIGSYIAIVINIVVLIFQFWIALWPIAAKGEHTKADVVNFFQNYLGFFVLIVFYFGHKLYKRNWNIFYRSSDIDIDTDRKVFDIELLEQEKIEASNAHKSASIPIKMLNIFC